MRKHSSTSLVKVLIPAAYLLAVVFTSAPAAAQSTDVSKPTPVFSNEVGGRIAPRDIGDARLTRHFFAFTGREGDLSVMVESSELNGDVDVFTASTLRPLLKITVFPTSGGNLIKKSVYLRGDETLILRVEGRASAESDARYRIRLEGAFGPAGGAFAQNEALPAEAGEAASAERKGRRTSSTGARIAEPVTEAAAQPTPETPAQPAETGAAPEAERAAPGTSSSTPRRGRGSRSASRTPTRRSRPAADNKEGQASSAEETKTEGGTASAGRAEENRPAETVGAESPRTGRANATRGTGRGRSRAGRAVEPGADERAPGAQEPTTQTAEPEANAEQGTRLVIVTRDGETIERDMRTVRRVTVERGQIVVVGMDGKVSRQPLTNVLRMAIEP